MAKQNNNKIWLIVLVIGLLSLSVGVSFYNKSRLSKLNEAYAAANTMRKGYSIYFETLKKTGLDVKEKSMPLEACDTNTCQIIVIKESLDEEKYHAWIEDGGVAVVIDEQMNGQLIETKQIGEGVLIRMHDADKLTNALIDNSTDAAYELYTVISAYAQNREIVFNEYYMQIINKVNFWDVIPISVKLILVELGLIIIAYFWYKGKQFGKPTVFYEEAERVENEYIYAVSALYKKAGAWDLVLESYYNALKSELGRFAKDEIDEVEIWRHEKLPYLEDLKKVKQDMESLKRKSKKINEKTARPIIEKIEKLKQIANTRRKEYWKI